MKAFMMNLDTAELFWSICGELHITDMAQREAVLQYMAEKGLTKAVWETKRTKEQFIKDLSKHYKTLVINQPQDKAA